MPQHARPENHSPRRISLKYIEEKHNGRSESIMGCLCGELHSLQGQGPEYPKHSSKPAAAQRGFVMKKSSTLPAGLFPPHPRSRPHCNERSPGWMQTTSRITNSWPQAPNQQFQDPHSPSGYWSHPLLQKSCTHTDAKTRSLHSSPEPLVVHVPAASAHTKSSMIM